MATVIRLSRGGRKKLPFYHVVVADRRNPRDGRFIEKLGSFDPLAEGKGKWTVVDARISHWLSTGAQPSDRVITYLLANKLGSDKQRAKWQAAIERRKQVNMKHKADAEAKKAAEAAEAAESAPVEAAAPAEEAPAEAEVPAPAEAEAAPAAEAKAEVEAEKAAAPAEEAPEAPAEKAPAEEAKAE